MTFSISSYKNIITIICFLFCISCTIEEPKESFIDEAVVSDVNEEELLRNFAKTLAISMKENLELRVFLKSEALKRMDGTYSVLYNRIKDIQLSNGSTINSVLIRNCDKPNLLLALTKKVLNLSIKIPTFQNANAESWLPDEISPSVAVNSTSRDRKVKMYDSNGLESESHTNVEPDSVVILVERNELITINSLETIESDIKNSLSRFYVATDFRDSLITAGGQKGYKVDASNNFSYGIHNPYFISDQQKETSKLYFGDLYIPEDSWKFASDNWLENELLIDIRVFTVVGDSKVLDVTTKGLIIPKYIVRRELGGRSRSQATYNRWVDFAGTLGLRPDLGIWDRTKQGNSIRIEFSESDPGGKKYESTIVHSSEFSIGIKLTDTFAKFTGGFDASYKGTQSATTKVSYSDEDDKLKEATVYFSDKIRQEYSTGLLKFTLSAYDGSCTWNWGTPQPGCDD